jgi:cyclic beta-1,2-glucan synthetase
MYRLLLETLLGVNLEGDQLRISPKLPGTWSTFTLHYRYRQTQYHIRIARLPGTPHVAGRLTLDGQALAANIIPLLDDHRDHFAEMLVS